MKTLQLRNNDEVIEVHFGLGESLRFAEDMAAWHFANLHGLLQSTGGGERRHLDGIANYLRSMRTCHDLRQRLQR